ncbi:MAG: hypothetical protein H6632_14105 [Anaerolineales bacterium]|nr:hypothetical protein [Anaerolineales bacterium]
MAEEYKSEEGYLKERVIGTNLEEVTEGEKADEYNPQFIKGAWFPHEVPAEHWKADFGDPKTVYQGAELPIWILSGWAIFIIWALVYLWFGLSEF